VPKLQTDAILYASSHSQESTWQRQTMAIVLCRGTIKMTYKY